jgi:hypothetical protein
VAAWPDLDAFMSAEAGPTIEASFDRLSGILQAAARDDRAGRKVGDLGFEAG